MTHEEIVNKVTDIIVDKLGVKVEEVVSTANFTNDLGADSLDRVELVMELEKNFEVPISDEVAEKISTVAEAIECIEKSLKEQDGK